MGRFVRTNGSVSLHRSPAHGKPDVTSIGIAELSLPGLLESSSCSGGSVQGSFQGNAGAIRGSR